MIPLLLAGTLSITSPHACGAAKDMVEILGRQYGEKFEYNLVVEPKVSLQLFRGKNTWSVILFTPDGVACMIAVGKHWPQSKDV